MLIPVVTAVAVALAGCGDDQGQRPAAAGPTSARPTPSSAAPTHTHPTAEHGDDPAAVPRRQVAQVIGERIEVFADPGAAAPVWTISSPNRRGVPVTFLVRQQRDAWLHVDVPVRPNGSNGWVRAGDVRLGWTDFALSLDLSEHRLTVRRSGRPDWTVPVAVGTAATPTPTGEFYLAELISLTSPDGVYGPFAFGLSAFSEALDSFNGQDPIIALHGTNRPELIGTDVSNGCIRMSNVDISTLANLVPLGTPITIAP